MKIPKLHNKEKDTLTENQTWAQLDGTRPAQATGVSRTPGEISKEVSLPVSMANINVRFTSTMDQRGHLHPVGKMCLEGTLSDRIAAHQPQNLQ